MNIIKIITALFFILSIFVPVSASSIFSLQEKKDLEIRLEVFLEKIDVLNEAQQVSIYEKLQDRIGTLFVKYEEGSRNFELLHILESLIQEKQTNNEKFSNEQILEYVLYSIEYDEELTEDTIIIEEEENLVPDLEYIGDLNEYEKSLLAGDSLPVVSYGLRANLEAIEVETVEFTFNQNIDNIGLSAHIYLNKKFIAKAFPSDIDSNTMVFDNIENLIVPEDKVYMQLELFSEMIGKDKIGVMKNDLIVTGIKLQNTKGLTTGDNAGTRSFNEDSKAFDIVPVKLSATVESEFEKNASWSEVLIMPQRGKNNENGGELNAYIEEIDIQVSSLDVSGDIYVFNSQGIQIGSANLNTSGITTIILTPDVISQGGETYTLQTSAEGIFYIPQNGIKYSAGSYNMETKLGKRLLLGQR